MEEEISKIMKDLKEIVKNVNEVQQDFLDPKHVSSKLIELQDRSRRNNLGIDGINENPNETWDECEARVPELIEVNLGITDAIEFDRCHRVKNKHKHKQILPKIKIIHGESFVK